MFKCWEAYMIKTKKIVLLALSVLITFNLNSCGNNNQSTSASSSASSSQFISSSSASSAVLSSSSSSSIVSDGESGLAANTIVENATRDGVTVTKKGLLERAKLTGQEKLTKTIAFNLFYLAYHEQMPEHVGYRKYAMAGEVTYQDLPSEAKNAVDFLNDIGLLTPEYDEQGTQITAFNGDEEFSIEQMKTYLDRFHAYFGTSEKDDFANAHNSAYIYDNPDNKDRTRDDYFADSTIVSSNNVSAWVIDYATNKVVSKSLKTKISAFQKAYSDDSLKIALNCSGAFKAYQAILAPTTYTDFFSTCAGLFKTQRFDPLFSEEDTESEMNLINKSFIEIKGLSFDGTSEDMAEGGKEANMLEKSLKGLMISLGFNETDSTSYAQEGRKTAYDIIIEHEKLVNAGGVDTYDLFDTTEMLGPQKFILQEHLKESGITLSPFTAEELNSVNPMIPAGKSYCRALAKNNLWINAFFKAMKDENLNGFKALSLQNEAKLFVACNPLSANQAVFSSFTADSLFTSDYLQKYYTTSLENLVIKDYMQTASYRNNLALISKALWDLRSTFKERINAESWLSEEGKKTAIDKVEKVRTFILASNDNGSSLVLSLPSYVDNDLYQDLCLARQAKMDYSLNKDEAMDFWDYQNEQTQFTPNAFYNRGYNGISMLMGYLASHGDFASLPKEELFAQLYIACGHELTHGLDTNGIDFDSDGVKNTNLFTSEDKTAYMKRVQSVLDFYQGREIMPGLYTNATTVISEACADVAGFRLVVDLAKKQENFDMKKFFVNAAQSFYSIASQYTYCMYLASDCHPYGRARCNCLVSSVPEFYSTFDIEEGEGMYNAPASLPAVW